MTGQVSAKWLRMVAPTADKLGLPGKMGVEVRLQPCDAIAAAELLTSLARLADAQEARLQSRVKMLGLIVLAVVLALVIL